MRSEPFGAQNAVSASQALAEQLIRHAWMPCARYPFLRLLEAPSRHNLLDIMDSGKKDGLQGPYLNDLRKRRMSIVIYLMNGMKQFGVLESFDQHSILLRQGQNLQLVYKHTVATMMPAPKDSMRPKTRPTEAMVAPRGEQGGSSPSPVPVIRRKPARRLVKPDE